MKRFFNQKFIRVILGLIFCFIMLQGNQSFAATNNTANVKTGVIKAGNYTLAYGKYKGYETDYDHEAKKVIKKPIYAELKKNEIIIKGISTKFKVKENKLYVKKRVMYEVVGNNRLLMLAGGGVILRHE